VLSAWLADHLPAYMVPADFLVLETLPLTANGKVDRKSLPEPQRLGEHKTQQPPRDTLELQLAQLWENILGSPPACIRDDFFAAGGNSLLAVRLLSQIRQHMGRDLSIAALFQQPNIEALAVLLRQTTTPPAWSPLVSIQKGAPDRAPLFCVHPGGGTVMCYMPLAQHLGAQQPVYGLQALGTEPGQTPYTAIADMARLYIDAMRSVQPHGPYRLAGWSLGGWIAYEMACQLERQGDTVSLLAVFDTTAPGAVCHSQEQQDEIDFIVEILEGKVAIEAETLRRLSPEAQIRHIIAQGQAVGLFPPDMDPDHVRRLIRVFQAGIQAGETYRPTSPYSGPMVLFQAQEQPAVIDASAYTAWADHVPAGVVTEVIPGNHQTLVKPPHVQVLAQSLKTRLG